MLDAELVTAGALQPDPPTVKGAKRPGLGIFFWCCVGWLGLLTVVTTFATVLPFKDPAAQDFIFTNKGFVGFNAPPSWSHPLGTDDLARDMLSRLVYGGRVSLVIGLLGALLGMCAGGLLGMLAAYWRGKFDSALSLVMYVGLAFPAIVAVLALLDFWKVSELHIIIVLGAFSVPLIFRLVRAATLSCATKEYVTSSRAQGASALRVILHDLLPNVLPSLIAYTVFTIGGIIATEGALGVLGLSVVDPTPSWGNMINEASNHSQNLSLVLWPAIMLFLTLISLNYAGERIRLRFDTSEQKL